MSLLKVNEVQNFNGSSLTLTASTVSTSAQLNTGGNISVTGSINVSDDSTTRSNLGLGSMATQNANAVAITGGTINTVQPASGQSLTIKDEDGNIAITIGTDNTAASYLSLNFGSYHGGSGTQTGNTLSDYETGTFTPDVYDAATGGNQLTSTVKSGAYTKIGDLVTVYYSFYNIVKTGATAGNNIYFRNLPFVAESGANQGNGHGTVIYHNIITNDGDLTATTSASQSYALIRVMGNNAADTSLKVQDIGTSGVSDIEFSVTYRAA